MSPFVDVVRPSVSVSVTVLYCVEAVRHIRHVVVEQPTSYFVDIAARHRISPQS